MILYPWLTKIYNIIIHQHQKKKSHHAILINTTTGMGIFQLIWNISIWLLCLNRKGIKSCYSCTGCQLMLSMNHPDWHLIKKKDSEIYDINSIHNINYKIYQHSQQGGAKIIVILDIQKLTESATNALLKTLEEPPENTWFLFVNYNFSYLHRTLSSRCIIYHLITPKEKNSLLWLYKEIGKKNISYLTALRLNYGSPISTKKFINGDIWIERINFLKNLYSSFKNKNLLNMLKILNNNHVIIKINWICLLLFDAIKFKLNEKNSISNLDQMPLIQMFSDHYSNTILDNIILNWIKCKYRLITIPGINNELLLLEQLLIWERI
ncbi:DNA polymerase III subunit delta' C-terminal domain-containing protein [Buchnera aphidicola]|uniref:DNA polymerase III subunit delta' C-terminal domain-containing protein n=1 Tax=Buchnera aphidicola TaxID=9 RepID=UPI003BEF00E5